MKRYLVVDCMSDWKQIMNEKEIRELLINEVKEDIIDNTDEREIVIENTKFLSEFAKGNMKLKDVEEKLGEYSFKIIDLLKIQMDIEDCKHYFASNIDSHLYYEFNGVLEAINKGVK